MERPDNRHNAEGAYIAASHSSQTHILGKYPAENALGHVCLWRRLLPREARLHGHGSPSSLAGFQLCQSRNRYRSARQCRERRTRVATAGGPTRSGGREGGRGGRLGLRWVQPRSTHNMASKHRWHYARLFIANIGRKHVMGNHPHCMLFSIVTVYLNLTAVNG